MSDDSIDATAPERRGAAMDRRKFLAIAAGVVAVGIASLSTLTSGLRGFRAALSAIVNPRLDPRSPVGLLTTEEMNTLIALSDVLVPAITPASHDDLVRDHVNSRTSATPGYLREYRNAVKLLEGRRSNRFAALPIGEREEIVGALLWKYGARDRKMHRLEQVFVSKARRAFRTFVAKDLIEALYGSPVGWAIVGYSHYPGVPAADPRDYCRPVGT